MLLNSKGLGYLKSNMARSVNYKKNQHIEWVSGIQEEMLIFM